MGKVRCFLIDLKEQSPSHLQSSFLISLHIVLELPKIASLRAIVYAKKLPARITFRPSSFADNIESFSERIATQAAVTMVEIIENLAALGVQEPGRGKKIDCAFYSSSMMLSTPRFSLPGHIGAAGGHTCTEEYSTPRGLYTEMTPARLLGKMELSGKCADIFKLRSYRFANKGLV